MFRRAASFVIKKEQVVLCAVCTPRRFLSNPTTTSYAIGCLQHRVLPQEMFPYPVLQGFEQEEGDNLTSLLDGLSSFGSSSEASTSTPPADFRGKLQELGFFGLQIPSEFGGLGLRHTASAAVLEALGRQALYNAVSSSLICSLFSVTGGSHLVRSLGSSKQKGALLPAMSTGGITLAWACEELSGGDDLSLTATSAELSSEPMPGAGTEATPESNEDATQHFVINGEKDLSAPFLFAMGKDSNPTHYIVLAKTLTQGAETPGSLPSLVKRNTLFVIPKESSGISFANGGTRLVLKNVHVPISAVLGAAGEGFPHAMSAKCLYIYSLSSLILGVLKRCVDVAQRRRPTANNEKNDMRAAFSVDPILTSSIYALESTLYLVTGLLDKAASDLLVESAILGLLTHVIVRDTFESFRQAELQCHSKSNGCEDLSKTLAILRDLSLQLESVDSLTELCACVAVEDFGIAFRGTSTLSMMQARTSRSLGFREKVPISWGESALIEKAIGAVSDVAESAFVRHDRGLRFQQHVQERIAVALMYIYSASAALSRAALAEKLDSPTKKMERKIASVVTEHYISRCTLILNQLTGTGHVFQ